MKKITQLFLTTIFSMLFAFSYAQGTTIEGQFTGGSVNNIAVFVNYGTGLDSIYSDAAGLFTGGPYATSGTQGAITINYNDCNGDNQSLTEYWNPGSANVDFGSIDICPSTTYDASATIQLSNVSSAVSLNVSWDNGATFTTVNTDASGYYYEDLTGISNATSSDFTFNFVDCNGNTVSNSDSYSSSNQDVSFNADYCPAACVAGFSLNQNIQYDQATDTYTVTGPVTVSNTSTTANAANSLTYTWDFGDGTATYSGVNFTHTYATAGPFSLCLSIDNGNGCTDTYCDVLEIDANGVLTGKTNGGFTIEMGTAADDTNGPTAINDLAKKVSLILYPNPAAKNISLDLNSEINENASIKIYDITGKMVQQNEIQLSTGNQTIDVSLNNLNGGLYIVQLTTKNGTLSKKLTIK